jgi:hypothetical protein
LAEETKRPRLQEENEYEGGASRAEQEKGEGKEENIRFLMTLGEEAARR